MAVLGLPSLSLSLSSLALNPIRVRPTRQTPKSGESGMPLSVGGEISPPPSLDGGGSVAGLSQQFPSKRTSLAQLSFNPYATCSLAFGMKHEEQWGRPKSGAELAEWRVCPCEIGLSERNIGRGAQKAPTWPLQPPPWPHTN